MMMVIHHKENNMEYIIKINCDNAAFTENPGMEVARILRKLADIVESNGLQNKKLMDINGNSVGYTVLHED